MKKNTNLKSSVGDKYFTDAKTVTQIIHFKTGIKRTIVGILPETLKQGQFTKFKLKDGSMVLVNDENVLMIEVFSE
jgi:hypothetical protein